MKTLESKVKELELKVKGLESTVKTLNSEKSRIQNTIDKRRSSIVFIKENNITKSNTEHSDTEDGLWFGHFSKFGEWLENNSKKKWCEWNGVIYLTSDIVSGVFERTDGHYGDLED